MSRFEKQTLVMFLLPLCLGISGCTIPHTTTEAIGGPYYLRVFNPARTAEPTYAALTLLYCGPGRTVLINDGLGCVGAFNDSIHRQFSWKVYGRNLAYVAAEPKHVSVFRLYVYSEKNGNILVDGKFEYWKVIADEGGITCHRYQDGQERDDPQPVVYTAQYLSGL